MEKIKKFILLLGDVVILYLSLILMLFIRYGGVFERNIKTHLGPFSVIFVLWLLIFYLNDLYRYKIFRDGGILIKNLFIAVFISGTVSIIAFYLFLEFFKLTPKTNLLIFSGVFLLLNYAWRHIMLKVFASEATNIIFLGDSPLIEKTISYLQDNPQNGYRIVEWIKDPKNTNFKKISETISTEKINLVIVPHNFEKDFNTVQMVYKLLPLEVGLINFWDFYEQIFEKAPLDELEEHWFVENIATRRKFYDFFKRFVDFLFGIITGIILLPFALIFSLLIKVTSRGPVIYKQKRIGKKGKIFTLYKFRTMLHNNNGPLWTTQNDNRITAIGKFLRFTHLDEIPQIINILKNDISLIGPRPERTELVEQYQKFPYYEIRHTIKPGLTGWAQINFRPSASLEEAYEKLCYDIYYIKNRSLLLDFLITLKTIKYVFSPNK